MNYSDQLKSPMWQKKRLEIMQRDNFTCQNCGDTETQLQVHHTYYEFGRKVWEYEDTTLITFCNECHENVSLLKKSIKYQIDDSFIHSSSLEAIDSILTVFNELDVSELLKIKDYLLNKYIYKNA